MISYGFQQRACNINPHSHALKTTELRVKITRIADMAVALDNWPMAIWFSRRATWSGILLSYIQHQKSRTHFSNKSKLKYFKISISRAIYDILILGPPKFVRFAINFQNINDIPVIDNVFCVFLLHVLWNNMHTYQSPASDRLSSAWAEILCTFHTECKLLQCLSSRGSHTH